MPTFLTRSQRLLAIVAALALLWTALPSLVAAAPGGEPASPSRQPALMQQDAGDASSGSVGENGTVNGQPRESDPASEPVNPAAPGNVMLPPNVTGATGAVAPNLNPGVAGGISGTKELTYNAIADTTVFLAAPGSPQTPESVASLAMGGSNRAVALISFSVEGLGDGVVLGARLTFHGAGYDGGPGGPVEVIYDYVTADGITANDVPSTQTALNVQGAPSWFERVEPEGITAVDVTGSVYGDGTLTFVLPGQSDASAAISAIESGIPPQLILTVGIPA